MTLSSRDGHDVELTRQSYCGVRNWRDGVDNDVTRNTCPGRSRYQWAGQRHYETLQIIGTALRYQNRDYYRR